MTLDQLRERLADLTYRLRPYDPHARQRRWLWNRPATTLQVLESLTPDQCLALEHALRQHLRRRSGGLR